MRCSLIGVVLPLLTGCFAQVEASYLQPSGFGTVEKEQGVPRIQQKSLGKAGFVTVRADRQESFDELTIFFGIDPGHFATLMTQQVAQACGGSEHTLVPLNDLRSGRIRDGVGYHASQKSNEQMVGSEFVGPHRRQGDRSMGWFWVTAPLRPCNGKRFEIVLPQVMVDGVNTDLGSVTFTPVNGRFIYAPQLF